MDYKACTRCTWYCRCSWIRDKGIALGTIQHREPSARKKKFLEMHGITETRMSIIVISYQMAIASNSIKALHPNSRNKVQPVFITNPGSVFFITFYTLTPLFTPLRQWRKRENQALLVNGSMDRALFWRFSCFRHAVHLVCKFDDFLRIDFFNFGFGGLPLPIFKNEPEWMLHFFVVASGVHRSENTWWYSN